MFVHYIAVAPHCMTADPWPFHTSALLWMVYLNLDFDLAPSVMYRATWSSNQGLWKSSQPSGRGGLGISPAQNIAIIQCAVGKTRDDLYIPHTCASGCSKPFLESQNGVMGHSISVCMRDAPWIRESRLELWRTSALWLSDPLSVPLADFPNHMTRS